MLDDLLRQDSSVESVELGRLGTAFDCKIRRNRVVHVISHHGPTPEAALRAAVALYREKQP